VKAIIPGSFDPITLGHLDLIRRVKKMGIFEEIIILVSNNPSKRYMFSINDRVDMIYTNLGFYQYLREITVDINNDLTANYAFLTDAVIIRGVRSTTDCEYELNMALCNKRIVEDIETIIIPTSQEYLHISSSAVREILKCGKDKELIGSILVNFVHCEIIPILLKGIS